MKINTPSLTEAEKAKRIINVTISYSDEELRAIRIKLMRKVWFELRSLGADVRSSYEALRYCKDFHPGRNTYELAR